MCFLVLVPIIHRIYGIFVFMESLKENDLSYSLLESLNYFWSNGLIEIVIFLSIMWVGVLIEFYFFEEVDFRFSLISYGAFVILGFVLTKFSLFMLSVGIGLFISMLWLYKIFEPKKNKFSTGFSFFSTKFRCYKTRDY